MSRLLLLIAIATYFISCNNNSAKPLPTNEATQGSAAQETRLGESNYFVQLPVGFEISEARGVEGQLGYSITPTDSSSTMFGFIEIQRGDPIGGWLPGRDSAKTLTKSNLLNKEVEWKFMKTDTGYFNVFTSEKGDLNARVSSKHQSAIDSLISIIGTLRQK